MSSDEFKRLRRRCLERGKSIPWCDRAGESGMRKFLGIEEGPSAPRPPQVKASDALSYVVEVTPFYAGGLIGLDRGSFAPHRHSLGWFAGEVPESLALEGDLHTAEYVVYSYDTPVAWWSESLGWYLPSYRPSLVSSRKHQDMLRDALTRSRA